VLDAYLRDNVKARRLQPDGSYIRVVKAETEDPTDSQKTLINYYGTV
jgi:polyphosphate kinase